MEAHYDLFDPLVVKCKLCSRSILQSAFVKHLDSCKSHFPHLYAHYLHEKPTLDVDTLPLPVHEFKQKDIIHPEVMASEENAIRQEDPIRKPLTLKIPSRKKKAMKNGPNVDSLAGVIEKPILKKPLEPLPASKAPKKPIGPMDLDKQCGVPCVNGGMCQRAITCKNHSVGAKRQVQGRSQSYDILVQLFQRHKERGGANPSVSPSLPKVTSEVDLPNLDPDSEAQAVLDGLKKYVPVQLATRPLRWCQDRHLANVLHTFKQALWENTASKKTPFFPTCASMESVASTVTASSS